MIRVVLVDDHGLVRAGLRTLVGSADDIEVVGEASDGETGVGLCGDVDPDVVLMDLSMPTLDGVGATRLLRESQPNVRVLVLSSFTDESKVREALDAGAVGYVLKDCTADELINAVRAAAAGFTPLDPRIAGALLTRWPQGRPASVLSDRETQVLRLTAQGMANKQIGRSLGITERTVKVHLGSVFRRIGVADRTSAALWARDNLPPQ